jgi:hypothetical protein
MMALSGQDLMGLEAFFRDGDKVGKIKRVVRDFGWAPGCLPIKSGLYRALVVPADVVKKQCPGEQCRFLARSSMSPLASLQR